MRYFPFLFTYLFSSPLATLLNHTSYFFFEGWSFYSIPFSCGHDFLLKRNCLLNSGEMIKLGRVSVTMLCCIGACLLLSALVF